MEKSTQNTNNRTVLILAAGYGRRMGPFADLVNKSLVPYNNKPLISHIFDKFEPNTRFVVACGHLGQQVIDYVTNVHSDKNVQFVEIDNFDESTTGPATTIRKCATALPESFTWITCDTLFDFDREPTADHNWIAVYPVDEDQSSNYCWIEHASGRFAHAHNKTQSTQSVDAFIGLMYVHDNKFLANLETKQAKDVCDGFSGIDLKVHVVKNWQDFGSYDNWRRHTEGLPEVSFPKPDELFYQDNGKIIKFTANQSLSTKRAERARLNPSSMPANVTSVPNFLFYDEEPGNTFYNNLTPTLFLDFLDWAETTLWHKPSGQPTNTTTACLDFYKNKTLTRVALFKAKYPTWIEATVVNGVAVNSIDFYVNDIDYDWLTTVVNWAFIHGDMQFDNIIYNNTTNKFTAIDWRPEFAGDVYGDVYYDLAKMLGGLYLSYKRVKADELTYEETPTEVMLNIPAVPDVEQYASLLQNWVVHRGYDWKKVQTIVPIIYLNMAPLHEPPFDKFLIALAQLHFSKLT